MTNSRNDPFAARALLGTESGNVSIYRLNRLAELGLADLDRLPFSIKVLIENLLRNVDGRLVTEEDVLAGAKWSAAAPLQKEIPFLPARVLLQDFTGVPVVVDLAAMRSAVQKLGGDPARINPIVPVDLVIDHSVQIDNFGSSLAFGANVELEYQRNMERYSFLRWAQQAFQGLRVVPPGSGICHQVNLEYLSGVVLTRQKGDEVVAAYDTLVGTDSHTTMINGLGVLGWGVGGIEAEAVMLGQPFYFLLPQVIGFRLTGELPAGATATDLVLTATQTLRKKGVVDKFVEFYGPGLKSLALADRATLANMAPEYGATVGFCPVDAETLRYLRLTGRDPAQVDLVERYTKEQGLFRTDETPDPVFSDALELDLGTVSTSLAGPRRPQDRVLLGDVKTSFRTGLGSFRPAAANGAQVKATEIPLDGGTSKLGDGSVVIAAITSCTNTSNPSVMVGAGLLARNAVRRGLKVKPYVKTSLAPGSRVVADYLDRAGLTPYLEALGYHVAGFGCTTCIGNSGPLPDAVAQAVRGNNLVVAAVLSGNRNFEGRISPDAKLSYLASPPLVVAYALAGTVDVDLTNEPIGHDPNGGPVYLREIWPTPEEIRETLGRALGPALFAERYGHVFEGDERWRSMPVPDGDLYVWDPSSTYIAEPTFFQDLTPEPAPLSDLHGARVLALLGDSVTTDHISPAGSIPASGPAGKYLIGRGVPPAEFNSFGARRGNHEVMMRGTLANIRLRNQLAPGTEGGVTQHLPSDEQMTIYDASVRYQAEGVPLLVIAGKEYGTGSSRDWAAKGVFLLGVKAALAESFERIHRSNLIGMGVLPLQFLPGENPSTLGLTGREVYDVEGIAENLSPQKEVTVRARREDGTEVVFKAIARLNSAVEIDYYRNGGILQTVLRNLAEEAQQPAAL